MLTRVPSFGNENRRILKTSVGDRKEVSSTLTKYPEQRRLLYLLADLT